MSPITWMAKAPTRLPRITASGMLSPSISAEMTPAAKPSPAPTVSTTESTRTAAEAAAALGCEVGAIASSLVFLADGAPILVLTTESDRFQTFQHEGIEMLYMLEGTVTYRHGEQAYRLEPGDTLLFDADAPHGPVELIELPARYLSIITYPQSK